MCKLLHSTYMPLGLNHGIYLRFLKRPASSSTHFTCKTVVLIGVITVYGDVRKLKFLQSPIFFNLKDKSMDLNDVYRLFKFQGS